MAGVSDTLLVTVVQAAVPLAALPDTASLVVGERRTFVVSARDANGQPLSNSPWTWTSSNPAARAPSMPAC